MRKTDFYMFFFFVYFFVVESLLTLLQQDALISLIRRAQPVFLQCLSAKVDAGGFDVPALRTQLHSTHLVPALQLYRIGLTQNLHSAPTTVLNQNSIY